VSEPRVRVPKDKTDLVDKLVKSEERSYGALSSRADVLTFCAVLGFRKGKREPVAESANDIRYDVFRNRGHDFVFDVLALAETEDPGVLENTSEAQKERNRIFEEYANGGLEILSDEFRGTVEMLDSLLLVIQRESDS
jgi:dnd system-associated protein 4